MRLTSITALTIVGAALMACGGDQTTPTAPRLERTRASNQRVVDVLDACDGPTFNAMFGAGTCARKSGMSLTRFIAQLQAHQTVGDWQFAPKLLEVAEGTTLLAVNKGGEVHTFTEVKQFGGGIVPLLNQLSGNPVAAPECLALGTEAFIAPGATFPVDEDDAGVEHYQCCIHPWMRATVHVHG